MAKGTMKTAVLLLLSCAASFGQQVNLGGSDTLILLGQRLSQQYQRAVSGAKISVRGGGTEQAYSQLGSSLQIVQDESAAPKFPLHVAIAVQGIAVYVNKSNSVNELTLAQLRSIFMGEITNWKEVGGLDKAIVLYAGESSTGTLAYFQHSVLRGEEPYPFVGKANAKDLVDVIASTSNAIGYSSLRYSPEVKTLGIKIGRTSLAVVPTSETIRTREYPISRYIYWTFATKPKGKQQDFVQWAMSQLGQTVVESVGFEPLLPVDRKRALAALGVNDVELAADK